MAVRKKKATRVKPEEESPETPPAMHEVPVDPPEEEDPSRPFMEKEVDGRLVMVHVASGKMYDAETGEMLDQEGEPLKRSAKSSGRQPGPTSEELPAGDVSEAEAKKEELLQYRLNRYKAWRREQLAVGNIENCPAEMPDDWVPPEIVENFSKYAGAMPDFLRDLLHSNR